MLIKSDGTDSYLSLRTNLRCHDKRAEVEVNMDNKKNESMEERAKKEELVVMLHSIRKVAEAHNESHTISHIDRLLSEMNDR